MPTSTEIQQAATIIRNDGVISYPTESVFGLGCDPMSELAVNKILQLKQRSIDKGLIIVAANLQQLNYYIEITEQEKQKILNEKNAVTWLVKKSKQAPHWVHGNHTKIAIRISRHPTVVSLCNEINKPIISTSANPAGLIPATSKQKSMDYFSNNVDLYLDDSSDSSGQPTQIKDIESDAIIR